MALNAQISQRELERVAGIVYGGQQLNVLLANVGSTGYGAESTISDWQSVECSGSGYFRFVTTLGSGSYSTTLGRFELPAVNAQFSATASYSFDRIVLWVQGATYPHSVIVESPAVTLSAGQSVTYRLTLNTDD